MKSIKLFILLLLISFLIFCENTITKIQRAPLPDIVTNMEISEVTENSAIITWETDSPCSTKIKYTLSGSTDTLILSSRTLSQTHQFNLNALQENSQYDFYTYSININNKATRSQLHQFTTLPSLETAWEKYQSANYTEAKVIFQDFSVLEQNIKLTALGLGWCFLQLDSLQKTITNFTKIYNSDPSDMDGLSGLSIAYYLSDNIVKAINFGEMLMAEDTIDIMEEGPDYDPLRSPFYVFQYDTTVSNIDVSMLLADSYFQQNLYEKAQQQIDFLRPDNILHPHDSTSWQLADKKFTSYENALQAYIDQILVDFLK